MELLGTTHWEYKSKNLQAYSPPVSFLQNWLHSHWKSIGQVMPVRTYTAQVGSA